MVEPTLRLTAEQALAHPFFRQYQKEDVRLFSPRKTFKVCLFVCLFVFFIHISYHSNVGVGKIFFMFLKEIPYAQQDCIYLRNYSSSSIVKCDVITN